MAAGLADGTVKLYLNNNTDDNPEFDAGTLLQVGDPGSKVNIDVGARATPTIVDWNSDGKKDLVVGALGGRIHIFINAGTDTAPDFRTETFAQDDGFDLDVPSGRSSPHVTDLDGDGMKDLLTGNTNGELLFYRNAGTNAAPSFSGYEYVESEGTAIDLAGTPRSRPFVTDWTGDGLLDVLIGIQENGQSSGKIHLYQSVLGDMDCDGDLDIDDVGPFVLALIDPVGYESAYLTCGIGHGDCNSDGDVNGLDIQSFVGLLLAP